MQESVIYQYIVQKEALKYTLRLLNRRFSNIDTVIIKRLQVLSPEQLESLVEDFLDFSNISDLFAWLEENTNN